MQQKTTLGYLAALGYAAIIGFSFIFVKNILGFASLEDVLAWRFLLAFIPLLVMYPFYKKECNFTKPRMKSLAGLAVFYPLLFFLAQTLALKISSSIEVGAVQAMAPIFTLILASIFLHERTNSLQKLSVLICVSGVMYIMVMKFLKNTAPDFRGIGVAFFATLAFSIYTVMAKKVKKNFTNFELLFFIVGFGTFWTCLYALGRHLFAGNLGAFFAPFANHEFVVGIFYLAFLSTLLSAFLINFALANIDASKMVVFNNLGTVIQILAGVIILKETLYPSHIIGSILIILGILGVNLLGQVDDVKNYVPVGFVILSILSFITSIFTFFMGAQNMSSAYIGSEALTSTTAETALLAELGVSYAMSFYLMTLIFAVLGIGFAGLYYLASKRLAAIKENERVGRTSYPDIR